VGAFLAIVGVNPLLAKAHYYSLQRPALTLRINDRGSFVKGKVMDLSSGAARARSPFSDSEGIPKSGEQCESFIMMTEGGDGTSIQPGFA